MRIKTLVLASCVTAASVPALAATVVQPRPAAPSVGMTAFKTDPKLYVIVSLPKATSPGWVGDDMAASFEDIVTRALHDQGYEGRIFTIRPEDTPPANAAALYVRLQAWKMSKGISDCEFTATLRYHGRGKDLGFFTGDNVVVTSSGISHFSADDLTGAALEAVDDLVARIRAASLIP